MIQNNLDPDVAENPKHLVVYGGIGRAARNWECFDKILETLKQLEPDETLLIQSGKPVGVFKTHSDAPRVLIANSNLVPKWANWEHFNELDRKGLFMYGQMTAGSWIYIGSQGIVQGTYETFAEAGRQHFGGDWAGRWILTAGLGGMGGAQPLAATLAGAVSLTIECQQASIDFRLRTRYLDKQARDLDDAINLITQHCQQREAVSIGLLGNAAEVLPELVKRAKAGGIVPDLVTDQTSAHDLVHGYLPAGWSVDRWKDAQQELSQHALLASRSGALVCGARAGDARLSDDRSEKLSITATTSARLHTTQGVANAFAFPGSCRLTSGRCSAKAAGRSAGSRCPAIRRTFTRPTPRSSSSFRKTRACIGGSTWRASASPFKDCRPASAGSASPSAMSPGSRLTTWFARGELKAPIVIGRDHLDTGSVASPNRETESMKDGTDAVSDWPLLNALLNTASGATWVSLHHGGGVGMGYSQHAGLVIVADGTEAAAKRLARVLVNDSGSGVMRHADAGYEAAIECARRNGLNLPMA